MSERDIAVVTCGQMRPKATRHVLAAGYEVGSWAQGSPKWSHKRWPSEWPQLSQTACLRTAPQAPP